MERSGLEACSAQSSTGAAGLLLDCNRTGFGSPADPTQMLLRLRDL